MQNIQRILGIDVGFAICGWSIVDKSSQYKNGMNLVDYGAILTSADLDPESRLEIVYDELTKIIKKYNPELMCVEDLFFFKNQKTVIKVGQVRGVILLAGQKNKLKIRNFTPLQVKVAVTGYGRADKSQVQKMVQMIFGLKEIPKPDDAADAIAIAVCYCNTNGKIGN
jgi:crossover junction endodeoxyribonuclease RuvC